MQPTILAFRLSDERLHTLRAVASAQGLAIIAVPPSDFSQTLGALCALDAALRALQKGPYSGKPLADIYRLMLWRGLGRTEELLKEREEMGGLAK